jgi:DNA-binding PadR family transcriptional regulator
MDPEGMYLFGPPAQGGRRRRRGEARAAILALLAEQPMHGYEIMQQLNLRTGGMWRPSPGVVYPALRMLKDEGLVSDEDVDGRWVFSLSEAGRARVNRDSMHSSLERIVESVDPAVLELRDAALQMGASVTQIAQSGRPRQKGRAIDVLKDARRRLYSILADGDGYQDDEPRGHPRRPARRPAPGP